MKNFQVLGQENVKQIHQATLRLLSETGIVLTHHQARELLLDHDARVAGERVRLPPDLVENCVAQCPHTVSAQGRDQEKAVELGQGGWFSHNVGGVPNVFEATRGANRPAVRQDVANAARLLDALPNVSCVTPHFTPQDVPQVSMTLWMYYETLLNTTKPIRGPGIHTAAELRALAEMARIASPTVIPSADISPISPLTFPDDVVEAMLEAAHLGLPLNPLPCPILGATAPMSIAGGLAQQNAEVLASVVLAQLARPGLSVVYRGRLSVMDPHTGLSVWGNPEIGLISAATVELGHHYGLPVNVYGFCTNAHSPDVQSGYERALNALVPVLAGADEISGVGEMDGGLASSLAQIVIDDEILTSIGRIRRGFEVHEDSLALDVVGAVMDGSRNFLAEMHTVRYLRQGELLHPQLARRDSHAEWEAAGRRGLAEAAEEKALQLLATHEPLPLSEKQMAALRDVILATEKARFGHS
jgi:trimethylamine--corrinoid protein Co-methyltransferase